MMEIGYWTMEAFHSHLIERKVVYINASRIASVAPKCRVEVLKLSQVQDITKVTLTALGTRATFRGKIGHSLTKTKIMKKKAVVALAWCTLWKQRRKKFFKVLIIM